MRVVLRSAKGGRVVMDVGSGAPDGRGAGQGRVESAAESESSPVLAESAVRAPGRRRSRQKTARAHAVFARFSDEEFAVVAVAAARAGVTTTSYVARSAVAVARGEVAPLPSSTGEVVRDLVAARTQLVRYGTLLNQAVAKLNSTGQADADLGAAVDRCAVAVAAVRSATERLGRSRG
jgi:hypothetical protein